MLKGYANYTVMLIPPKNCLKKMVHFLIRLCLEKIPKTGHSFI